MGAHIVIPIWEGQTKTTVEISDALLREVRQVAALTVLNPLVG
jgi:hypothetical protein